MLERFAVAHRSLPVGKINRIIVQVAEAVEETRGDITGYMADHPEFRQVGGRMLDAWSGL